MPRCSVIVCKNTSSNVNYVKDGVSFHTFPKDGKIKEKWINATGMDPKWFPTKNSTICSVHFEPKCFLPFKKVRRLFEWSIPTLKLRMKLINYMDPCTLKIDDEFSSGTVSKTCEKSFDLEATAKLDDVNKNGQLKNISEHTGNQEENEIKTPRERKLRLLVSAQENVIKKQKLHIKRLQKKTSRYRKVIVNLKNMLQSS